MLTSFLSAPVFLSAASPLPLLCADWEPTLINLGHALRKLRRWGEALECYHRWRVAVGSWQEGWGVGCEALGHGFG